ncbi:hypothetical protein [Thiocapsa marina]|nr:hypothetical protein [Thiocapsa marina]
MRKAQDEKSKGQPRQLSGVSNGSGPTLKTKEDMVRYRDNLRKVLPSSKNTTTTNQQTPKKPTTISTPTRCASHKNTLPRPTPGAGTYRLAVTNRPKLAFESQSRHRTDLLDSSLFEEHGTQCHGQTTHDEREIVVGLDFGTSSVKVVIGDSALGYAFAVPFTTGTGIARYLLPCCLYRTDELYSLHQGSQVYRDLKLALVANPTERTFQEPVIAFLAFVIRHARNWLLREHRDKYHDTHIFWKLRIGLPVAHRLDEQLSPIFEKLARIAWLVAGSTGPITRPSIRRAEERHEALLAGPEQMTEHEDIDVDVVPEIAAQIYGFVNSNRFDRKARNLYLIMDVGAGTVDSSLFRVNPARGGKWDFEFFTSAVEPNGVMNLHRHRINWWQEALQANAKCRGLVSCWDDLKFPTDRELAIPDCYTGYFQGIEVDFNDTRNTPDRVFFGTVLNQVSTNTYMKAWQTGLLEGQLLKDIPTFYCGGGTRMLFYDHLRDRLRADANLSWFGLKPHRIELPSGLEAPGLKRDDYDRLTVAYGLSFLEVGKIVKAIPEPKLRIPPTMTWRDNYADKDYC